uniref:SH2 domain-containing protein n=1 Tax=Romanomermis culicivorax TaxID=13658 RepID=A0A915KX60_ROMCU
MSLHGKSTAAGGSSSVGSSSSSGDAAGGFNWSMKDYYHGEIRKEFCEDLLKEDGDFLIRLSKNQEFVISVLCCGKVRHFQPDYDGSTYSLGDKEYAKIDDLIFYHWSQHVPIGGEANAKLKKPIERRACLQ